HSHRTFIRHVVGRWCLSLAFAICEQETTGLPRPSYQDDFETPGISPRSASCRKHRRHSPNLRRKARGRPQILQRLCLRVENFGLGCLLSRACLNFSWIFASLTRFAVVDKSAPSSSHLLVVQKSNSL